MLCWLQSVYVCMSMVSVGCWLQVFVRVYKHGCACHMRMVGAMCVGVCEHGQCSCVIQYGMVLCWLAGVLAQDLHGLRARRCRLCLLHLPVPRVLLSRSAAVIWIMQLFMVWDLI